MYLCICVLVLSSSIVLATERGAPCTTPYGERATCISILSCPGLVNILLMKNKTSTKFAIEFQCGYDTEPLVCCRLSDYPPGTFDVFTKPPPPHPGPSFFDLEYDPFFQFPEMLLPEISDCGRDKEANTILPAGGGNHQEFPWLAALEYKNKFTGENAGVKCGGSIVNKEFILTAAECMTDPELYLSNVWVGDLKLSSNPSTIANFNPEKAQKLKVRELIPHPFYSNITGNNDIGMLRLQNDIKFTDYVQPVCLPPPRLPVPTGRTPFISTGWETQTRTMSSTKLKQAVQMLSNYICQRAYQNRQIGPNQMCAAGTMGRASYQGDPGGLLMRAVIDKGERQARWYQEGVGSWEGRCQRIGEPFVYTRVSRYIRWITNVMSRGTSNMENYEVLKA